MSTAMSSRTTHWRWWHSGVRDVLQRFGGAIWIRDRRGAVRVRGAGRARGRRRRRPSEVIRGLRGDGRGEYWARVDLLATTFAGLVAITAIIGMCRWGRRTPGRRPVLAARRGHRRGRTCSVSRSSGGGLSSDSKVGSFRFRGGLTSRHVQSAASLSSRNRISFVRGGSGCPAPCRTEPRRRASASAASPRGHLCPSGLAPRSGAPTSCRGAA